MILQSSVSLNCFNIVTESLMSLIFLGYVFRPEVRHLFSLRKLLYACIYISIMLFEELFLAHRISFDSYLLYLLLHAALQFLFCQIFCHGTFWMNLFFSVVFTSFISLSRQPSIAFTLLFARVFPGLASLSWYPYFWQVLVFLILILLTVYLIHFRIDTRESYPFSYYLAMLSMPFLNLAILTMLKPYAELISVLSRIGMVSLLLQMLMYYIISRSTRDYLDHMRLSLIAKEKEYQEQYMEQLSSIVSDYHQLRHDMKNHLVIMDRMLSMGKYRDLKQYFYSMNQAVYDLDNQIETGNETINEVINIKYALAHQKNIPISFQTAVPHELPIPGHLLCSLLSNLLDNAIEASQQIGSPEITVKITMVKSYLSVTIRNRIEPWQKERALSHKTAKENPQLHGLGMRIVRNIAGRYHGITSFSVEEDWYTASVMLEMPDQAADGNR